MKYKIYLKNGQELKLVQPFLSTEIDEFGKAISFFSEENTQGIVLATVTMDSLSHIVLVEK